MNQSGIAIVGEVLRKIYRTTALWLLRFDSAKVQQKNKFNRLQCKCIVNVCLTTITVKATKNFD